MLHALRVLVGPEDVYALVGGVAKGFQALVALHAVVEAGRHAVDAEVGVGDELGVGPFPCCLGVGGLDVAVYFADAEADVGPVCEGVDEISGIAIA